jgi:ABC-type transporter Mla maintaining outer membrane lipid asymmetry ATPase subunit MlaF
MSDTKAILKIEDLTVSIQEKKILDKLNIQVLPGQVHAIMGKKWIWKKYSWKGSIQTSRL